MSVTYAACTLRGVIRRVPRWTEVREILVAKKDCPLFYAPSELVGSMTFNLPTVLIDRYFGAALAGNYGVVLRLCGAPVTIVSSTISQVYHASLAQAVRERLPGAHRNFLRLRRVLFGIGALSGVGVFLVVPLAISFLFGDAWRDAGNVARALSPMYATMIAISPLAVASFQVFEEQRTLLILQVASALIALLSFSLAGMAACFWCGVGSYSLLISVRYLVFLARVNKVSAHRLLPFDPGT